jgi:hypothetical protein
MAAKGRGESGDGSIFIVGKARKYPPPSHTPSRLQATHASAFPPSRRGLSNCRSRRLATPSSRRDDRSVAGACREPLAVPPVTKTITPDPVGVPLPPSAHPIHLRPSATSAVPPRSAAPKVVRRPKWSVSLSSQRDQGRAVHCGERHDKSDEFRSHFCRPHCGRCRHRCRPTQSRPVTEPNWCDAGRPWQRAGLPDGVNPPQVGQLPCKSFMSWKICRDVPT